jgi:hypothetical protein
MKSQFRLLVIGVFVTVQSSSSWGTTLEEFKSVYDSLQRQVLDRSGEVAQIDSFTYTKDVATFHFGKGVMLLQRPVNGRPTLAAFVGKGHVHIDIPPGVEQLTVDYSTAVPAVDDTFQVFFARIADDFDLAVKSKYTFKQGMMGTIDYGHLADFQGPFYFTSPYGGPFDHLSMLTMSVFERSEGGYFWAVSDNCRFFFNPYSTESVEVIYSGKAKRGRPAGVAGASFQKMSSNRYRADQLSDMTYPVTPISLRGTYEMEGADGWTIKAAAIDLDAVVELDSIRFVSLLLDKHFLPDSIKYDGQPIDYFRRTDYEHLVLLPDKYAHAGDTLSISLWFHNGGNLYGYHSLRTENPVAFPNTINLIFRKGYNYAIPFSCPATALDNKRFQCETRPVNSWYHWFQPLPTGYDTASLQVDDQMVLTLISSDRWKHLKTELPEEVVDAFRFYLQRFGTPSGVDDWYVFPGGNGVSPGLLRIPVSKGEADLGGLHYVVGRSAASAWFGPSINLASYRENWLRSAVPQYLGVLYLQKVAGNNPMYTILSSSKQTVENLIDDKADFPISVSGRSYYTHGGAKGVWLLHMLRVLMFDIESLSDDKFMGFLKDVVTQANQQRFSNADFCRLAEQHFGGPLDWFFAPWLYKRGFPTFESTWNTVKDGDAYYVDLHVATTGVDQDNIYPVILKVTVPSGSALLRQAIAGSKQDYRIGPFPESPTDIRINEYESILCNSKVRKL